MPDFVRSLIIESTVGIFVAILTLVINPFLQYSISLSTTIIIIVVVALAVSTFYSIKSYRRERTVPHHRGARTFGCDICGKPFDVFPPDDVHIVGVRDGESEDAIIARYECVNHHQNIIYWDSSTIIKH